MSGTWSPSNGATPGNDSFTGTDSADAADGLGGNDTLVGLGGDDILIGNTDNDSLAGGAGNDVLLGGAGNDTMIGGSGADNMDGGTGTDFVSYQDATSGVSVEYQGGNVTLGGAAAGDTIANIDGFIGSNFDDTILVPNGQIAIFGGDGNDIIQGGQQADTIVGGAGSDTIFGNQQSDSLVGGFFALNGSTLQVFDDSIGDAVIGGSSGDSIFGGRNDTLVGGDGNGDFAFLPAGFSNTGSTINITYPTDPTGGTSSGTFQIWSNGQDSIYLNGFEGAVQFYPDVPCFASGTLVATARGEVAVENLRVGDLVLTAHGGAALQPVVWIGHSKVNVARQRGMAPILIKAGALAEGVPARDLRVSPEHAMFLDGRLVPARLLVNGTSIVQELWCPEVTYWHVELPAHGLLVAEGAVSESYFDDGNRKQFDNFAITTLFKDFESERHNGRYAEAACYPLLTEGPALERLQARLAARAGALTVPPRAAPSRRSA
jgi:hypothetical protein